MDFCVPAGAVPRRIVVLVPSARLELAQLSPLPPQDSVSTNFTTTAVSQLSGWLEAPCGYGSPASLIVSPDFMTCFGGSKPFSSRLYLAGMPVAAEAAGAA